MGWTAYYQLLRSTPLTDDEAATVGRLVVEATAEPWDAEPFGLAVTCAPRADAVLAHGMNKVSDHDVPRLVVALNELLDLLPGATLRLADDLGVLGCDAAGRAALGGKRAALVALDGDRDGDGDWHAARDLAPPVALPMPAALAVAVASGGALDEAMLGDAMAFRYALEHAKHDTAAIDAVLARAVPATTAAAGLRRYHDIHGSHALMRRLEPAMDATTDIAPLIAPFLHVWRNPRGTYWYGDLSVGRSSLARFGAHPAVIDQLEADLIAASASDSDDDLPFRRAEKAAVFLAAGRTDRGLRVLLGVIRRLRGRPMPWRVQSYVYDAIHTALAAHPDARAVPTWILHVDDGAGRFKIPWRDLPALATLAADRFRPFVSRLLDAGVTPASFIDVLRQGGADSDVARLRALTAYPELRVRKNAVEALRALGVAAADATAPPPAEELVAHPDAEVRRDALRELADRKDSSLFVSLVLGEELDARLRRRIDGNTLPFSWRDWNPLPDEVVRASFEAKLAWADGAGRDVIGHQRILDALRPVQDRGAAQVADACPLPVARLDAAEVAALCADEDAIVAALAA